MSKSATTREPLFSISRSQRTQFLAAFEGVRSCLWSTSPRTQNSSSSMVATAYAGHVLFLFINRISFFYLCFFFFFFFFCLFVEKILDLFQLVYTYKYYLLLRLYEKMSWSSSSSCEISSRWKRKNIVRFSLVVRAMIRRSNAENFVAAEFVTVGTSYWVAVNWTASKGQTRLTNCVTRSATKIVCELSWFSSLHNT